eukprot:12430416-Karenia_brevis.AAC.1
MVPAQLEIGKEAKGRCSDKCGLSARSSSLDLSMVNGVHSLTWWCRHCYSGWAALHCVAMRCHGGIAQ